MLEPLGALHRGELDAHSSVHVRMYLLVHLGICPSASPSARPFAHPSSPSVPKPVQRVLHVMARRPPALVVPFSMQPPAPSIALLAMGQHNDRDAAVVPGPELCPFALHASLPASRSLPNETIARRAARKAHTIELWIRCQSRSSRLTSVRAIAVRLAQSTGHVGPWALRK